MLSPSSWIAPAEERCHVFSTTNSNCLYRWNIYLRIHLAPFKKYWGWKALCNLSKLFLWVIIIVVENLAIYGCYSWMFFSGMEMREGRNSRCTTFFLFCCCSVLFKTGQHLSYEELKHFQSQHPELAEVVIEENSSELWSCLPRQSFPFFFPWWVKDKGCDGCIYPVFRGTHALPLCVSRSL